MSSVVLNNSIIRVKTTRQLETAVMTSAELVATSVEFEGSHWNVVTVKFDGVSNTRITGVDGKPIKQATLNTLTLAIRPKDIMSWRNYVSKRDELAATPQPDDKDEKAKAAYAKMADELRKLAEAVVFVIAPVSLSPKGVKRVVNKPGAVQGKADKAGIMLSSLKAEYGDRFRPEFVFPVMLGEIAVTAATKTDNKPAVNTPAPDTEA